MSSLGVKVPAAFAANKRCKSCGGFCLFCSFFDMQVAGNVRGIFCAFLGARLIRGACSTSGRFRTKASCGLLFRMWNVFELFELAFAWNKKGLLSVIVFPVGNPRNSEHPKSKLGCRSAVISKRYGNRDGSQGFGGFEQSGSFCRGQKAHVER